MAIAEAPRFVRADGPDKVTGSGRYTADINLTGQLVAKFKYAGVAHARIVSMDVRAAQALPGVFAVLTADDVPDVIYSPVVPDRRLFAKDVVRFEGEVVAAVAAVDAATAQAAVDAIVVEYDPLPIVDDLESAMAEGSPLVHDAWESYAVTGDTVQSPNVASFSSIEKGDVDAAMAEADHVITSRYVADGCHALPIEPRAVVAQWEGEKVTVWTSTQVPFDARNGVCETLQMPASKVRIIVPHLGGGFGGKCGFHFEAHIAALAKAARRPVKLVFSRQEEMVAPDRRREGMIVDITSGVKADGTLVARTGWIAIDNGAYTADAAFFPQLAAMHVAGPYNLPAVKVEASLVYTNHQPSGSVRAPTAPQACWALESHTDEIAALLGMDRVEFRRRNIVDEGREGAAGQVYGEIGLRRCLDAAVEASAYGEDLPDDEAVGVAISWWPSFPGPSGAYVKIDSDGSGMIITGAQECGTGSVMTLRLLAAKELGMDPEDFQLVYQDTSVAPFDTGATGSQTLLNNGRAVIEGAREVAAQLRDLAAEHLEAAADDIVLVSGTAHVSGSPDKSVTITELAGIGAEGELLIGKGSGTPPEYPTVSAQCVGDQGLAGWAGPQFACHAVHLRLDRDTGVVRVLDISAAHDSGTIINPIPAHGQVEGGIMMGIGQALTEGTQYGDDAKQRNTGLLEYKLQTAADAPTVRTQFIEVPDPNAGPYGAKGLAEAPNVPTAAAIANGIAQLLGGPVRQLPMTAERVWMAIDELGSVEGGAS
ncbi:MAG: xanthine dehydrogenase family protein molybdopterin-binding subunit [Actinomycetota bacterium]